MPTEVTIFLGKMCNLGKEVTYLQSLKRCMRETNNISENTNPMKQNIKIRNRKYISMLQ